MSSSAGRRGEERDPDVPQQTGPLPTLVAANPVFAGVAYFNSPALFDGIIDDDLVIRETFEAGDSRLRMDKLTLDPLSVRLNYFDSISFVLSVQEEGDAPPNGPPQGFGYDTTLQMVRGRSCKLPAAQSLMECGFRLRVKWHLRIHFDWVWWRTDRRELESGFWLSSLKMAMSLTMSTLNWRPHSPIDSTGL